MSRPRRKPGEIEQIEQFLPQWRNSSADTGCAGHIDGAAVGFIMTVSLWKRNVRRLFAVLALAGISSPVVAQQPSAPFPVPRPEDPIEFYYGVRHVTPERTPFPVTLASVSAVKTSPKAGESFRDALTSMRESAREITAATVGLLGKVGGRIKQTADTRPIIIATYSAPVAQPQMVLVRDKAEARPVLETPAAIRLDTFLACGFGLLIAGLAVGAGLRKSRKAIPASFTIKQVSRDDQPLGNYNSWPKRDAAEKFDLGPTYHEEMHQKEQAVEANNSTAVEFIIAQNLALLAALNPDQEGAVVQTDAEGIAAPTMA